MNQDASKKITIFTFLLIILASSTFAVEFEGYKYSGDIVDIGGDKINLSLSNNEAVLVFKSEYETKGVMEGNCESTQYFKYCYNYKIIDYEKELIKLHDYTGAEMPALNITIISLKPELTISIEPTTLTPNEYEEIQVKVYMSNKGKKKANLIINQTFSNNTIIKKCTNCLIDDSKNIIYQGIIYPSDEEYFSYHISPKQDIIKISSLANYKTDVSNGTIPVSVVSITPKISMSAFYTGVKEAYIESEYDSTIIIKNEDPSESITHTTTISSELIKDETVTQTLKPGEQTLVEFVMIPTKTGSKEINVISNYKLLGQQINFSKSFLIESKVEKPIITLDIPTTLFSDQESEMKLKLNNLNSKNSFQDIKIKVTLDNNQEEFLIPFLKYQREITPYQKKFSSEKNITTTINAKVDLEYKTIYDEILTTSLTKNIIIKPITELITIEHDFEDYKLKDGELIITTFLTNNDVTTQILNLSEKIIGSQTLTNDGREIEYIDELLKSQALYVESKNKKSTINYMIKKQDDVTTIETTLNFKGLKNVYEIKQISSVDFNKKTESIISKTFKKIKETGFEEISGIIEESIQVEETYKYDAKEIELDKEVEVSNKSEQITTQTQTTTTSTSLKRNFLQKIWDVIKSFF